MRSERSRWQLSTLFVWITQELLVVSDKPNLVVLEQFQVRLVQLYEVANIGKFLLYLAS